MLIEDAAAGFLRSNSLKLGYFGEPGLDLLVSVIDGTWRVHTLQIRTEIIECTALLTLGLLLFIRALCALLVLQLCPMLSAAHPIHKGGVENLHAQRGG